MRIARALIIVAALPAALLTAPAVTAAPTGPAVLHVGQIARENVAPRLGSEPDTVVEPDIAVDPMHPLIAVAAFHDGRYADGGAVDIGYAWTHDGGRSWHDAPVPYLTRGVGGPWARASDPVLAFAADGTAYLSVLVFQVKTCATGVTVQRSTNGGATWSRPVLAHISRSCTYSDDKNWITVDQHPTSPHFGRVYQFWTPFRFTVSGRFLGAPQALRWSDDKGMHWSSTHYVSGLRQATQDSQPMIGRDGTLVDAYLRFPAGSHDDPEHHGVGSAQQLPVGAPAPGSAAVALVARTSVDGGATWSGESVITPDSGGAPADVRCCLPSAVADPVTGGLYATWIAHGPGLPVVLSRSVDGRHWSAPVRVDRDRSAASSQHVNTDVTADHGRVFVSYGTRDASTTTSARYVQQKVSASYNAGASFAAPAAIGPRSDLKFSAFARADFPGDYTGSASTSNRVYVVWARSSHPSGAHPGPYHQLLYAAALAP